MAFNFPSGAVPNQLFTANNGIVYRFNGITWVIDGIDEKLDSLNDFTSSYYVDSSSFDSKLDSLISATSSYLTSENVIVNGGLELTGSISGGYSRIHFVSESSGETGSNLSTIQMVPDINSPSNEQILIIDPTGGYPNHLHLRPGGPMDNSSVSIILGGENSNVSVIGGTNPPIQITSNNYLWQFNTDGTLIFPDSTNQTTAFTGLPIGSVSGSSQLTSSFDERYTLSGSVQPLPNGLISGSSQLTSSYDTRYTLSGSIVNSNINTGSFATTGSNSFNGNQTITGSLVVSSVAVVSGGLTIPTGSVITLTSGSSISVDASGTITSMGGITGSIAATNGVISGSSQLTTSFPSKTTGNWTVPAGASTQSFSVESGASYTMWVNGNIPNGIITWNATVTTSNTNVPVVGFQYGWYYSAGNALVLTAMPDQIVGTNGSIISSPASYAPNTSNVFKFGITNNSGTTQTINYGYIKLS